MSGETELRVEKVHLYEHLAAIDSFWLALVDDPDAIVTARELAGVEEAHDVFGRVTLATELWSELWPDGDEAIPELDAADARAALRTSEIFARLAANPEFLAQQAVHFAALAWAGGVVAVDERGELS